MYYNRDLWLHEQIWLGRLVVVGDQVYDGYFERVLTQYDHHSSTQILRQQYKRLNIRDLFHPYFYSFLVHRVVWIAYHGPIDNNYQLNHIDCNKHNNFITNLELVTQSENIQHAYRNNLITKSYGEDHHSSYFTNEQAEEIRRLRAENPKLYTQRYLATKYGSNKSTIADILNNKRYIK